MTGSGLWRSMHAVLMVDNCFQFRNRWWIILRSLDPIRIFARARISVPGLMNTLHDSVRMWTNHSTPQISNEGTRPQNKTKPPAYPQHSKQMSHQIISQSIYLLKPPGPVPQNSFVPSADSSSAPKARAIRDRCRRDAEPDRSSPGHESDEKHGRANRGEQTEVSHGG